MKNQFNYLSESFVLDSSNPIYCNSHQKNRYKKKQALANENQKNLIYYFTKFLKPVTLDYIYPNP